MTKKIMLICFCLVALAFCFVGASNTLLAHADDGQTMAIKFSGEKNAKQFTINADISGNQGLYSMKLTLAYNSSAMKLTNFSRGTALSEMDLKTTDTKTEQGFAIRPFEFSFTQTTKTTDTTNGIFLTLNFDLENISDGTFYVTFDFAENDVTSLDAQNNVISLNPKMYLAKIVVKNGEVNSITNIQYIEQSYNVFMIIGFVVGVVAVCLLIYYPINKKMKKNEHYNDRKRLQKNIYKR